MFSSERSDLMDEIIDYKFDDLNVPLVTANGDWKIRIVAGETGTYPGSTVGVGFWFEV